MTVLYSLPTNPDGTLKDPMPTWRRWASLTVLSVALLTVVMDLTVLNVALPSISAELTPSATGQLWMVDAYSLVLAGLLIPMSALADRWGRRRLLILGFAVFGLASLLVLWADSTAAVIALRALLGLGGAMIMPTTLSMLRVVFTDPHERTLALGVWAAVSAAGAAVGPIVGGLLLEHFSWHAAFLVNVPPMIVAIVAAAFLLPESRLTAAGSLDLIGSVLAVGGVATLVWSIKEFGKHYVADGFANPPAWIGLIGSAVVLTLFVMRCLRRPEPLLDVRLFRRPQLTAGVLAALFSMLAMGGGLLLLAQWLQLVEGHSPLQAGIRLLPFAVGAILTSIPARNLVDLLGVRVVMGMALLLPAAGFLLFYLAPAPLAYPWVATAMLLQGAGAGALAIGSAMIMSGSPQDKAGNAAAIEETAYDLGNVFGVALLGTIAAVAFNSKIPVDVPGADESLAEAMEVARQTGSAELAAIAQTAFTDAIAQVGIVGAVMLAIAGGIVFWLTPRGLDLDIQH
ncbi:MFS transporter [Gordonia desulfuricans]|uniref:MFS transporter n=1 Tax=Gordonia desulfuricans TaxID=89051 RepID=A0A7K3LTQ9_9ACTN|nr:MFS transporter [Gordonia desulfuricans]NDK91633.1 MFS transporter [Gordonia desulfuricans]